MSVASASWESEVGQWQEESTKTYTYEPWCVHIDLVTSVSRNVRKYLSRNVQFRKGTSANGKKHHQGYISHLLPASVVAYACSSTHIDCGLAISDVSCTRRSVIVQHGLPVSHLAWIQRSADIGLYFCITFGQHKIISRRRLLHGFISFILSTMVIQCRIWSARIAFVMQKMVLHASPIACGHRLGDIIFDLHRSTRWYRSMVGNIS